MDEVVVVAVADAQRADCARKVPSGARAVAREVEQLALLRVLQGGQPVGVPESFFDAELLALCSPVAQLAGRVAGAHQAGAAQSCSDAFLYYRLQYLAGQGRLHLDASHPNPAYWQVRSPVGCALPV